MFEREGGGLWKEFERDKTQKYTFVSYFKKKGERFKKL